MEDNRIYFCTECGVEGESGLIELKFLHNHIDNFIFLNPNYKIEKVKIEYTKVEVK